MANCHYCRHRWCALSDTNIGWVCSVVATTQVIALFISRRQMAPPPADAPDPTATSPGVHAAQSKFDVGAQPVAPALLSTLLFFLEGWGWALLLAAEGACA